MNLHKMYIYCEMIKKAKNLIVQRKSQSTQRKSRRSQKSFICQCSKSNQGYILMIGFAIGTYILKLHSTTFSNFESGAPREGKSNGNTNISQSLQSVALL